MKGAKMHFSLILIGLLFVFSPDLSIFDFLPDFIGWFFITLGLNKFADIESRGEDAKKLADALKKHKEKIYTDIYSYIISLTNEEE